MKIDNCHKPINGSRLGYACYGRNDGIPAFYFHGLPGSRREGGLLDRACLDRGVRLIAPERPGYGLSDTAPGSRIAQWPSQIAILADHLGLDRFYLLATSGGAPYALACAALLQHRVRGTGICCGLAEVARPELCDGLPGYARLGFWLARRNPLWLDFTYGLGVMTAVRLAPRISIALVARSQGRPDRSLLSQPQIRDFFAENLREAFRQGSIGAAADMCAAIEPWPFELSLIRSLQLWHGGRDHMISPAHSTWLADQVPGARLVYVAEEGHFSLPVHYAADVVEAVIVDR